MAGAPTWRQRANFKKVGKKVDTGMEIDPAFNGVMKDLIEKAYPGVGRQVEKEMEAIWDNAVKRWPVSDKDKPHSKDTIKLAFKVQGDDLTVSLNVGAFYADMITEPGDTSRRNRPAQVLIWTPGEQVARSLVESIPKAIVK